MAASAEGMEKGIEGAAGASAGAGRVVAAAVEALDWENLVEAGSDSDLGLAVEGLAANLEVLEGSAGVALGEEKVVEAGSDSDLGLAGVAAVAC